MSGRYLRYVFDPRSGMVILRLFGRFVAIKAPWCRALFSERARAYPVIPLGFGWRITLRKVGQ